MSRLRITSLEAVPVALPFREPYRSARGELSARSMLVVSISASDGTRGYGDAVPLSLRGGPGLDAVRADLEGACASALRGADLGLDGAPERAGEVIDTALAGCAAAGAGPGARAAVDAALLDLLGRLHGVPAWRLLGAHSAAPVACNGSLGEDPPERLESAARELVRQGFGTLKLKVGSGGDDERLAAVRAGAGEAARLRIDANGSWDLEQATVALERLAPLGLELAEQPCAELAELVELRRRSPVPLVADESAATIGEAELAIDSGACDAVTVKLAKVGGTREALRIAARVPAYLSSALDSALGIAAALHAAQALPLARARLAARDAGSVETPDAPRAAPPMSLAAGAGRSHAAPPGGVPEHDFAAGLAHGLATTALFADNVADAAGLEGPAPLPPPGPGLGIDVDEEALERLRIR